MEFGSPEWMACMGESIKMFKKASSRFKEVQREYNQAQEALSNAQTQRMDEEKIAQLQDEVARIWEVLVQERKVVDDAMYKYLYLPFEHSYLPSRHPKANSSTTDPADSNTCKHVITQNLPLDTRFPNS